MSVAEMPFLVRGVEPREGSGAEVYYPKFGDGRTDNPLSFLQAPENQLENVIGTRELR